MLGHGLFERWLFGALCGSLLAPFPASSARAQAPEQALPDPNATVSDLNSCSPVDGRAVLLDFGERVPASLAEAVRADLRVELERRGIGVCEPESTPATLLANVRVDVEESGRIVLDVRDHATGKQVARDVSLSHLPENGRALAIAIAIDELLRASWAELSLAPAPKVQETAAVPVATEAKAAVVLPAQIPEPARAWLTLQGSYTGLPNRYAAFGAQLAFDVLPWEMLWFDGRLGVSRALEREVGPGSVSIDAIHAGAALGACLSAGRLLLTSCLGASVGVDVLSLQGKAEARGTSMDATRPLLRSAALVVLLAQLSERFVATGSVSAGAVLSGVRVTDAEETLLSLEGLVLTTSVGLGMSL